VQSVPIATKVVSSNPVYSIQYYVIKFASDLRQVSGFLQVFSIYNDSLQNKKKTIQIVNTISFNIVYHKLQCHKRCSWNNIFTNWNRILMFPILLPKKTNNIYTINLLFYQNVKIKTTTWRKPLTCRKSLANFIT
jgi:hypothetical protein